MGTPPVEPMFYGLRKGHYGVILADPPWPFRIWSGTDNTPSRTEADPYPTMTWEALAALPVADLATRDCVLFLWVVDAILDRAIPLATEWGFKYKTRAFEWLKTKKDGSGYAAGMGFWSRKECESCLLFTRGSPKRQAKDVRQIIEEPRREHSRKPDETYRRIEALVAGPYCELFATQRRDNWDGWGRNYPL